MTRDHGWIETPLGLLYFATREGALTEAGFVETWARETVPPDDQTAPLSDDAEHIGAALLSYFDGDFGPLDRLTIAPRGTDFQRAVWHAIRDVPAGQTASYRQIAEAVGRPAATRAVGTATGRNPLGIAVPCHRIIRSDGGLGGYGGGLDRKRWLLDHERRHMEAQSPPTDRSQRNGGAR